MARSLQSFPIMVPQLSLVPLSGQPSTSTTRGVVSAVAGVGVATIGLVTVGWSALAVLFLVATSVFAIRLHRDPPKGSLAALQSLELRTAYHRVLQGLSRLDDILAKARGPLARRLLERARGAAERCGQLAASVDPVELYLNAQDRANLLREIDELRERTSRAHDPVISSSLAHTTAARLHQLATHDRLAVLRDQVLARLDHVTATFDALVATQVQLDAVEQQQLVLDFESELVAARIEDELETLEGVLGHPELSSPSGWVDRRVA